jgi:hypothetical protein
MAYMTDNTENKQPPDDPQPAEVEDPGYLITTGETASDDGEVVPIIGGLPAVEGSAWDIGAPQKERGAGLAAELETEKDGRPE